MLNCNVVKDLLPNYVDGLVSEKTRQEIDEHLSGCTDCKAAYEEMKAPLTPITMEDVTEIDYLKKVKRKNKIRTIRYSVISALAVAAIFIVSVFVFYIGKPVNIEDFSYSLHKESEGSIRIDMKLENGLVLHAEPEMIWNNSVGSDSNEVVFISTLKQSVKIPFDDMGEDKGSSYSWGYGVVGDEIEDNFTFILRFSDRDVVLTLDDF